MAVALILLSASALSQYTKTAKAANPIIYASPASQPVTINNNLTAPFATYNMSVMANNLNQALTITASVRSADPTIANVTNYYPGHNLTSLGFSYVQPAYDPDTGTVDTITAFSSSPISISSAAELFIMTVQVKSFAPSVVIDIYDQYAGGTGGDIIPEADCPNDQTLYMSAITAYTITVGESVYTVTTISNSTVSGMTFEQSSKSLNFTTIGPDDTTGYVNVTIPKTLLDCPAALTDWVVLVDDNPYTGSATITQNSTHTFVYLAYSQSTHGIHIIGKVVVPEYPSIAIIVTFLTMTTIALAMLRKVHKKRWQTL